MASPETAHTQQSTAAAPESFKSSTTLENTASDDTTINHGSSSERSSSFVDYTPPPDVNILPPAKYKLWILVFVLVYFAVWVADEAGLFPFLRFDGWLSPEASLFLMLAIVVFVLTYSTMDLVIQCLTFTTTKGQVYGVGAWLKQPRAQWMYNHENLFYELAARVIHILEDGFSMFDAPPPPCSATAPKQFECNDQGCEKVLKIEHRIRADKLEDYRAWLVRIRSAMKHAYGFVGDEKTEIRKEEEWDEEKGKQQLQQSHQSDNNDINISKQQLPVDQLYQVVYLKFENLEYLNDWMLSPRRKALLRALEPMLAVPDTVQIQGMRQLPDCFTDLAIRQGQAVPKSPPKKWKIWWLNLIALFITVRWSGSFLPYYYEKWGLSQVDDKRLERIIGVLVDTFLHSYVVVPLFLFVFDHWVHHSDGKCKNVRQPWKMLDEGFQSIWPKIVLTLAFYGGCVIAAVV